MREDLLSTAYMCVTSDVQYSRHFVPFDVFKSCAKRPSAGSLATCTSSSTLLSGIVLVIVCHHFDLCFSVLMCYSDAIPYMLQHICHSGIQYYTDTLSPLSLALECIAIFKFAYNFVKPHICIPCFTMKFSFTGDAPPSVGEYLVTFFK